MSPTPMPDRPIAQAGSGDTCGKPGLSDSHPVVTGATSGSALLRAYAGLPAPHRPVWFMRQAGRSLPEYRRARATTSMLQACLTPELAAEITCQPVRRHRVDAGIFFSDIVVPLKLAGVRVEIVAGVGPVIEHPIRRAGDLTSLPELDPAALEPVRQGVRLSVEELRSTPLIGFAGAPFTLASYLIEGRPDRALTATRALLADDPGTWHRLLGWVSGITIAFLRAQGEAGASALQVFDSWVGRLSPREYRSAVQPHSAAVFAGVADLGLPRVHFGTATADLLPDLRDAGADVMGVSHDISLDEANQRLGGSVPLQGNLDPALLAGPEHQLHATAATVCRAGDLAPGHVFNLGHGVPPDTDPDVLTRLVEFVHEHPGKGKES